MYCRNSDEGSDKLTQMRQRANILEGDILEVLGTLPTQERLRVEAIINEVEDEVCRLSSYDWTSS